MTAPTAAAAVRSRPRLPRLLALQVRTEFAATLRSAEFVGGVIAIPVLLYAMFGLPPARNLLPGGTSVGAMMAVSFSAYGIVSLAIFTFGDDLAKERGRGWTRTLRATPLPTAVHLAGKTAMALAHATLIVLAIGIVAGLFGDVRLDATTWLRLGAALVAGVLAFSTVGFALAYLVRPRAATMIANLLFLPLSFCSGFFFPLRELPSFLQTLAPYLPTYHFGQLAWQQVADRTDVEAFVGVAPQPVGVHLAWVLGCFLVFGALAIFAAGREAVARRG
ncbi:ABC transporter permease [Egicoccus sp. AB-alg2]|uniref:ABC transporter permease n=1 Tax=Egicoccus sp. AB-alg2 TaxID=3242693 RepID=UPI00359E4B89